MKELEKLLDRVIQRVNINLREHDYDVNPFVQNLIPVDKMMKFFGQSQLDEYIGEEEND